MAPVARIKTARIITIGNEIVTGKITNTNSVFISRFLFGRGYRVSAILSVRDEAGAIGSAVRDAIKKSNLVIITGGLGPTHDDITKKTLCSIFKCKTRFNRSVLKQVESFFRRRGTAMTLTGRECANIPTRAAAVENPLGVAPGLFFEGNLLALPGVPHEMEAILKKHGRKLIPPGGGFFRERIIHTAAAGETSLVERMTELGKALQIAEVAFLPYNGRVSLRIIASGKNGREASGKLRRAEKYLRKGIEDRVWGFDEETIETVVGKRLMGTKKSLAVAESCTGGGIGHAVTSVPGSSNYFMGGIIAYSDEAKLKELGVSLSTLKMHGAVSKEVALEMAGKVRAKFDCDYGLSATGIAGPTGGTKEKPVGLVYVAVSGKRGESFKELRLGKNRELNRDRTVFEALHLLFTLL